MSATGSLPFRRWNAVAAILLICLTLQQQCSVITSRTIGTIPHGSCSSIRCEPNMECVEHKGGAGCYNTTCPMDEFFSLCPSNCEPNCDIVQRICHKSCGPPACQCRPSFVRYNGSCIQSTKCPQLDLKVNSSSSSKSDTTVSSTCLATKCTHNHHCEMVADEPKCLPDTTEGLTCEKVDIGCLPGYHCEDTSMGMKCAPNTDNPPLKLDKHNSVHRLTCEDAKQPPKCALGHHCEVINGNPECIADQEPLRRNQSSCALISCPSGETCEVIADRPQCIGSLGLCAAVYCATGDCVEYDGTFGCFNTTCSLHEEFKTCATCEIICGQEQKFCTNNCLPPTCQCEQGYVRHRGRCVTKEQCEKFVDYGAYSKRFISHS